jgi:hypothetical protein
MAERVTDVSTDDEERYVGGVTKAEATHLALTKAECFSIYTYFKRAYASYEYSAREIMKKVGEFAHEGERKLPSPKLKDKEKLKEKLKEKK